MIDERNVSRARSAAGFEAEQREAAEKYAKSIGGVVYDPDKTYPPGTLVVIGPKCAIFRSDSDRAKFTTMKECGVKPESEMADDDRWAAEWWKNNGGVYIVGGVKYATLPTAGNPPTLWRVDQICEVAPARIADPPVMSEFRISGGDSEYIESNATVGQFFALLRLIEGLGK